MGWMRRTCTGWFKEGIKLVHHVVLQPNFPFLKYHTFSVVDQKLGGSVCVGGGGGGDNGWRL